EAIFHGTDQGSSREAGQLVHRVEVQRDEWLHLHWRRPQDMIAVAESPDLLMELPPATNGEIAVVNLKSALQASWNRFWRDPQRPGVAEVIVEQEQQAAQYLGDLDALDRLEILVNRFIRTDSESSRIALVQAQFASITHRFAEARDHAAKAESLGAPSEIVSRLSLSIEQACGTHLDSV